MKFEEFTLQIPEHWLSAIINGDESSFDYYDDDDDYKAYQAFVKHEIDPMAIIEPEEESHFCWKHDATGYGVLACNVVDCKVFVPVKP